ncbi:MAG: alpha/beta hydrolase-fold protein, partial [Chloroflexota bacterium]
MPRLVHSQVHLLWLILALTACSSPAYANVPPTPTPAPATHISAPTATVLLRTATRTATATASATLTPSKTPTPVCVEGKGLVVADELDSETLNYPIELQIYLPPCYEARKRESYPVLYLLHGQEMNEKTWGEIGVGATADSLINSGDIPSLIIVMPRERRDSRFGDALVSDILPYIDSHYRTLADRDHRALSGMSRGAGWALRVGLQNP